MEVFCIFHFSLKWRSNILQKKIRGWQVFLEVHTYITQCTLYVCTSYSVHVQLFTFYSIHCTSMYILQWILYTYVHFTLYTHVHFTECTCVHTSKSVHICTFHSVHVCTFHSVHECTFHSVHECTFHSVHECTFHIYFMSYFFNVYL